MKKYESLNFLKAIACLGIVAMHILANTNYNNLNIAFKDIIMEFTNFVYLFMTLSSFGLCCGYFEKIKNNEIDLEKFYKKRYSKIFSFFMILTTIDLFIEHSFSSLIEGFCNFTMMFGFIPNQINVIGVGWFIGTIFVFYFMFPFFVFLFSNKKRAWSIFSISIIMNYIAIFYFNLNRHNMFYSFMFLCLGGILYLYKDNIINFYKEKKYLLIINFVVSILMYIFLKNEYFNMVIKAYFIFTIMSICITVENKIFVNKFFNFISQLSFEIYLSHMFIFRIVEKMKLTSLFSNDYLSYIFVNIVTIIGCIIFIKIINIVLIKMRSKNNKILEE